MEQKEEFIQNLKDAGCGNEKISRLLACYEGGQTGEELKLLRKHRECLLGQIHRQEQKLSCLDYLIYQIEKEERESR